MLGRDFEDEVRSRSVFELVSNPIGYFGKMNSTLGSVVPLAMFKIYDLMLDFQFQIMNSKCVLYQRLYCVYCKGDVVM